MTIRFSEGLRDKLLGENGVDTGADGLRGIFKDGIIEIRTGAQPATANAAVTGTLLGTVTIAAGAFTPGVATNGLEFDAPSSGAVSKVAADAWQFNGVAAGTAGWFRFKANALDDNTLSTTLPRIDGSVAKTGGDLNLSNTSIVVSAPHTIDTFTLTISLN
jgi:hypothetical protein